MNRDIESNETYALMEIDNTGYEAEKSHECALNMIRNICHTFAMGHDESAFDITYNMKMAMGILSDEEVFLSHDDSWFKSARNGFMITSRGIYCRPLLTSQVCFTGFEALALMNPPQLMHSTIYADGIPVAYYTASDEDQKDLLELISDIRFYARDLNDGTRGTLPPEMMPHHDADTDPADTDMSDDDDAEPFTWKKEFYTTLSNAGPDVAFRNLMVNIRCEHNVRKSDRWCRNKMAELDE